MKKYSILCALFALISFGGWAQAPDAVNYQAVVRDGSGQILTSQTVGIQFVIRQGSATGVSVYSESFTVTTNNYGLVHLKIGTGANQQGSFGNIDWENGPMFLETGLDNLGGTNYVVMGTTEFVSVPYAISSKLAENVVNDNVNDADADPNNEIQDLSLSGTNLSIESGNTIDLSGLQDGTGTDDQTLTLSGTDLSIESGNTIDLSGLQDGTGTDDQNLSGATLTGSTLQIDIENGNSASVDLSPLQSNVWSLNGTSAYYSTGNVGVGTSIPQFTLDVDGDVGINDFIYHNEDNDTYMGFTLADQYDLWLGGVNVIDANTNTVSMPVTNIRMQNIPATNIVSGDRMVVSNSSGFLKSVDPNTLIQDEVIEITNANHASVSVNNNEIVRITEEIFITANYSGLDYSGIHVSGGKITGTGSQVVRLDNNAVVEGVVFENVSIRSGVSTQFISCTFIGVTDLGFESKFQACVLNNCNVTNIYKVGSLQGCEINNCLIPRCDFASDCDINNTTFGDNSSSEVAGMSNCFLSNSKVYVSGTFNNNSCENVNVVTRAGSYGVTIADNTFDRRLSGEDNIVLLDVGGTGTTVIKVTGNAFTGASSLPQSIKIQGTYSGSSSIGLVGISDNLFSRGTSAVTSTSNIRFTVNNNATTGVSNLGVSNGINQVVRDNDIF